MDREAKAIGALIALVFLINLAVIVGLAYVAIHFLLKVW